MPLCALLRNILLVMIRIQLGRVLRCVLLVLVVLVVLVVLLVLLLVLVLR